MFPGLTVTLKAGAHIGHGAVIHGSTIGKNVLVGVNAVIMDHVIVGDKCIIGALTFIPEGAIIPERKVVVGNPFKIIKYVSDEMLQWKTNGTALYQALPKDCHETLKPCEPYSSIPKDRDMNTNPNHHPSDYKTWKEVTKDKK